MTQLSYEQLIKSFYCQSTEHTISKAHCNKCLDHCNACCDIDECNCCGETVYEHKPIRIPKRWFCIKCNVEVKPWHFAGEHGLNSDGAIKLGVAKLI